MGKTIKIVNKKGMTDRQERNYLRGVARRRDKNFGIVNKVKVPKKTARRFRARARLRRFKVRGGETVLARRVLWTKLMFRLKSAARHNKVSMGANKFRGKGRIV